MAEKPSYLQDSGGGLTDNVLKELSELAEQQLILEEEVKELEKRLKLKKEALFTISSEDIPMLLHSSGVSQVRLANGKLISIQDDLNVTITDNEKFFDWLKEHRQDDIIKTVFRVDRMESDKLRELFDYLIEQDVPFAAERNVHHQTLKKFFKELTGMSLEETEKERKFREGLITPINELPEFCKVFTFSKTKIK